MKQEIAEIIKDQRKTLNLTQQSLSDLSGVSLRQITRVETADGNISLDQLLAILEVLGIKLQLSTSGSTI